MPFDNYPGRTNPFTKLIASAFEQYMRSMMVSLPAKIVAFDPDTQLAQIQCTIQKVNTSTGAAITMPIIENVPVQFSGTNDWYMWHEVNPGCEGIAVFSQRALDTWINTGKISKPHDLRMFSENDAMFIPGVRTKPNAIPNFKNEGMGISNYAGTSYIHVKNDSIDIVSPTINKTGDEVHTGNLTREGNTETNGSITNNGKNIGDTHNHDGSPTAAPGAKSPTGVVL